jgi:hypothetical protein
MYETKLVSGMNGFPFTSWGGPARPRRGGGGGGAKRAGGLVGFAEPFDAGFDRDLFQLLGQPDQVLGVVP